MLSRNHLFVALLVALSLVAVTFGPASLAQKNRTPIPAPTPNPPSVTLEADTSTVTICAGDISSPRVQLRANARSPEGRALTYRWRASGGAVTGEGANATWDLTGVRTGVYTATVEVESGVPGEGCMAFTSIPIAVNECPPARIVCPNIAIYCPDTVTLGAPLTFNAEASGGSAGITPTYNWTVSAGQISAGQGTSSITVDTAGLGGKPITATVEVLGYNLTCRASCTTQIPAPPDASKFDEFGNINFNNEKARLDNFAVQLQNAPGAQGHILIYPARRARPGETQRRAARARDYLVNERGIGAERILIQEGEPRENLTIQLWIVPVGAVPPRPSPRL